MYEFIPEELKKLTHWVCWKAVPDPKAHSGISKKPINPKTGGFAQSNNPDTWSDFDTAVRVSSDFAGIGFMFSNSGYFGVDLDDMQDDMQAFLAGDTDNAIAEFVLALQSYTELSNSGNGIHIICKGKLPEGGRRKGKIEMYDSGRFFVMTGKYCTQFVDISECTEKIKPLHKKYFSDSKSQQIPQNQMKLPDTSLSVQEIVDKAMKAQNGEKFKKLYNGDFSDYTSQSEADIAFCNLLAFWCGGDIQKMDEIFRSSGLMREKWDRNQTGSTYGKLTLQKAASQCNESYKKSNKKSFSISISQTGEEVIPDVKQTGKMYRFDDTGNAERLCDNFGNVLRYCYIDKKWLFYSNGKWFYDNIGCNRKFADAATNILEREYPLYADDEKIEKAFHKHLSKSRSYTGKTNMLHEAEHLLPILPSHMDKNTAVFNCVNGMADLRTGKLIPHSREAFITKQSAIKFDPDAPPPEKWLEFLDTTFGEDKELIEYIQKAVGYSLTGSTAEQCAFFLYGTGRNGKSTFLEIIRNIMGDYATNIQPQTIMINSKAGNAPTSDIARLKGARFVTSVEPNAGMMIDEGLLKQLTGDDIVTARKMFSEEFEFKPEFKIWMATNHKPIIRGTDTGIWRRIHMIPFEIQVPEDKVDRHLKYKLSKESSSILKWAVDGCIKWKAEGLKMPKKIADAVKEYKHEMDVISAFVDNCCVVGEGEEKASRLYYAYAQWADENNEYKMSSTKFGAELAKRYNKSKTRNGAFYKGISLNDEYNYSISICR